MGMKPPVRIVPSHKTHMVIGSRMCSFYNREIAVLVDESREGIRLGRILVLAPSKNKLKLVETSCNTSLKWRRRGMNEAKVQNN